MYDSKGQVSVTAYEIMLLAHITGKDDHECKGSLMEKRDQQP